MILELLSSVKNVNFDFVDLNRIIVILELLSSDRNVNFDFVDLNHVIVNWKYSNSTKWHEIVIVALENFQFRVDILNLKSKLWAALSFEQT
jgi:hypothetical protein